jgi:hypothetical protein
VAATPRRDPCEPGWHWGSGELSCIDREMDVIAFAVYLNGRRLWTAGVGSAGVLTTIVTWATKKSARSGAADFHVHVGGIDAATDEHVTWKTPRLKVGDKIIVKVVETDEVDRPTRRFHFDKATNRSQRGKASKHK